MRILVTRPVEDSTALRHRLEALGHQVMAAPMLSVAFEEDADVDLRGVQGLIATSRNGLKALAQGTSLAQAVPLPLFAVGSATADAARALGFKTVITGPGTARELIDVIATHAQRDAGSLVHLSGQSLAFDTKGALETLGFSVRRIVLYHTHEAHDLAADVVAALRDELLDAVILMSPKSAEAFVRLSMERGLTEAVRKLAFLCLSADVARSVSRLAPFTLMTARSPNLEEMLALVTQLAANSAQ